MKRLLFLGILLLPFVTNAQQQGNTPSHDNQETLPAESVKVEQESPGADSGPLTVVEQMPEFPGGPEMLHQFLAKHLKYPEDAREKGISGRVYVSFVVNEEGGLENIKITRGVFASLDKEAVRVVSVMPNWIPGRQNGKPVKVQFTLPVFFELR